jgi:hypothetical protein
MERQQFQAKAVDDIPNMLREGFKDLKSESAKQSFKNISESGGYGKNVFANAVKQHFSEISPSDFLKEFNRFRRPLQDSGLMDAQALDHLRVTLEHIPKDVKLERWKRAANSALIGTMAAELSKGKDQ